MSDTVSFTIVITANLVTAGTFKVTDILDGALQPTLISNGGAYTAATRTVAWTLSLPAGNSTTTLSFTAKVLTLPQGNNAASGYYQSNTCAVTVYDATSNPNTLNNIAGATKQ